jgi:probable F420-dependent oxidoreductase
MKAAEQLGFASVWVPEHHLSEDGYNPAPLPLLAAMAVQTTRVAIGTSVLLLPFHHPVRVAEEAAAVDNLSNGRLILGLGLGYRLAEFAGYGIDRRTRGGRMEEGLEILRRCWTEDRFSFEGKFYQLKDVALGVRPVQRPHPPLVLGARGPRAAERAARLGLSLMPTGDLSAVYEAYSRALAEHGRSPEAFETYGIQRVFVTPDPERDWETLKVHVMEESGRTRRWYNEAHDHAWDATPLVAEPDAAREREFFIIGPPGQCVREIQALADLGGLDHLILHATFIGLPLEKAMASMALFAGEVMPRLADYRPRRVTGTESG